VSILRALAIRLARLNHRYPDQDWAISLRRIPARPRSGAILTPGNPRSVLAADPGPDNAGIG
jgi:fatty-acid peroxygenase